MLELIKNGEEDSALKQIKYEASMRGFKEFQSAYDDEYPTFTVNMHVSGTYIRKEARRISKTLELHHKYIFENSSRIILPKYTIDRIRALLELPRLQVAEKGEIDNWQAIFDEEIPINLQTDLMLVNDRKMYFDFIIDSNRGGALYAFTGVDVDRIKADWRLFISPIKDKKYKSRLDEIKSIPVAEQVYIYKKFLQANIKQEGIVNYLLPKDAG